MAHTYSVYQNIYEILKQLKCIINPLTAGAAYIRVFNFY